MYGFWHPIPNMGEIQWPWQYSFPPFFTLAWCLNNFILFAIFNHSFSYGVSMFRLQPNVETRKKQLDAWRTLLLDYCRAQKICVIDVNDRDHLPVFNNTAISSKCFIYFIDFQYQTNNVNYVQLMPHLLRSLSLFRQQWNFRV